MQVTALQQLSVLISQCRTGRVPLPPFASAAREVTSAAAPPPPPASETSLRFIDIGANLLDPMFQGVYRGKQQHPADLRAVLERAAEAGVERCIVTAGSLAESREAIELVRAERAAGGPVRLYCTVGVHPTRALEFLADGARAELELALGAAAAAFDAGDEAARATAAAAVAAAAEEVAARAETAAACAAHAAALREVVADGVADGSVVAVGECGLDYEREHFCPRAVQRVGFAAQLGVAAAVGLPLFLHNRNSSADLAAAYAAADPPPRHGGVVHSFDGSADELQTLLGLGLDIGLNGCSLRAAASLAVAAAVPLGRLHLETDAPWCGVKRTHAGYSHVRPNPAWPEAKKESKWAPGHVVKDRCEPAHIAHVLQVLAAARGDDEAAVAAAATANSERVFFS